MWKLAVAAAALMVAGLGCDTDGDRTSRAGDTDLERETGRAADRAVPMTPQEPEIVPEGQRHADGQAQAFEKEAFLKQAAEMNHAEIAAGQLASERGENAQVKEYGQRLVEDHRKNHQELQSLAQNENVTLPDRPDEQHRQRMEQVRQKSGAEFDKAFVQMMVEDHRKAVSQFEAASRQTQDDQVKAYCEETLPVLREHLQQAQELSSKVGAPTAD